MNQEWIEKATVEKLMYELDFAVCFMGSDNAEIKAQAKEHYEMIKNEMIKRMSR